MAAARDVMARLTAGDVDGFLAHMAEGIVYEAPYYPSMATKRSKAELAAQLAATQRLFSRLRYDVVDLFPTVDPDLVIVEVQGDNELAGSDRRYQNHYLMFLRFTDGLVSHWREFSNPDVFRQATS